MAEHTLAGLVTVLGRDGARWEAGCPACNLSVDVTVRPASAMGRLIDDWTRLHEETDDA